MREIVKNEVVPARVGADDQERIYPSQPKQELAVMTLLRQLL